MRWMKVIVLPPVVLVTVSLDDCLGQSSSSPGNLFKKGSFGEIGHEFELEDSYLELNDSCVENGLQVSNSSTMEELEEKSGVQESALRHPSCFHNPVSSMAFMAPVDRPYGWSEFLKPSPEHAFNAYSIAQVEAMLQLKKQWTDVSRQGCGNQQKCRKTWMFKFRPWNMSQRAKRWWFTLKVKSSFKEFRTANVAQVYLVLVQRLAVVILLTSEQNSLSSKRRSYETWHFKYKPENVGLCRQYNHVLEMFTAPRTKIIQSSGPVIVGSSSSCTLWVIGRLHTGVRRVRKKEYSSVWHRWRYKTLAVVLLKNTIHSLLSALEFIDVSWQWRSLELQQREFFCATDPTIIFSSSLGSSLSSWGEVYKRILTCLLLLQVLVGRYLREQRGNTELITWWVLHGGCYKKCWFEVTTMWDHLLRTEGEVVLGLIHINLSHVQTQPKKKMRKSWMFKYKQRLLQQIVEVGTNGNLNAPLDHSRLYKQQVAHQTRRYKLLVDIMLLLQLQHYFTSLKSIVVVLPRHENIWLRTGTSSAISFHIISLWASLFSMGMY